MDNKRVDNLPEPVKKIFESMLRRRPDLKMSAEALLDFYASLVNVYDKKGKLIIAGNGGSNADAVHIVGELEKSFIRKRPLPPDFSARLEVEPFGNELAKHLEVGFPAIAIGTATALKTAVENDSPLRDISFAQETYAMIKPDDLFLGISTSGNAVNVLMAMSVARAKGAKIASLTGPEGGKMAEYADIAIKTPGENTAFIQEYHIVVYHTFCAMVEAHYFSDPE